MSALDMHDDEGSRCECCDSYSQHVQRTEKAMLEFLSGDPGPMPAHYTEEMTERALRGIERARKERGL